MKTKQTSIVFAIGLLTSTIAISECVNPNITTQKPDSIYVDHGDGTVTDSETGLMWQKCVVGLSGNDCLTGTAQTFSWQAALAVANNNGDYGYNDWRLANRKELNSLVDNACYPVINPTIFPNTPSANSWTSSPAKHAIHESWVIYFDYGGVYTNPKSSEHYIRLVRSSE